MSVRQKRHLTHRRSLSQFLMWYIRLSAQCLLTTRRRLIILGLCWITSRISSTICSTKLMYWADFTKHKFMSSRDTGWRNWDVLWTQKNSNLNSLSIWFLDSATFYAVVTLLIVNRNSSFFQGIWIMTSSSPTSSERISWIFCSDARTVFLIAKQLTTTFISLEHICPRTIIKWSNRVWSRWHLFLNQSVNHQKKCARTFALDTKSRDYATTFGVILWTQILHDSSI